MLQNHPMFDRRFPVTALAAAVVALVAPFAPMALEPVHAQDRSAKRPAGAPIDPGAQVEVRFRPGDQGIAGTDGGIVGWAYDLGAPWPDGIRDEVRAGYRLMRTHVQLDAYRDRPLDDAFLARLESGFDAVRTLGAKVIPRFTYNNPSTAFLGGTGYIPDAPLAQVLTHIAQLGPVLARHADVIAWFEAGFVGAWGEWHSSRHRLDRDEPKAKIRDALLASFPADRQILFRYPGDVQRWYPAGRSSDALHANGIARVGIHNDCFMSDRTDGNTFPDKGPADLRDFTARWNRETAYGGETCQFKPKRTACRDIQAEGPRYGLTYLNRFGTLDAFKAQWKAEGCLDSVISAIGPRIELQSLRHPVQARAGEEIELQVVVRNAGWSRIPNRRRLELVLEPLGAGATARLPLPIDSDGWAPGQAQAQVVRVRLVTSLAAGRYRLALASPDPSASLAGDPRYGLSFANSDDPGTGQRWDAARARFETGSTLEIRASAVAPKRPPR